MCLTLYKPYKTLAMSAETKTVYSEAIKDWGWGFDAVLGEEEVLRPDSGWLLDNCLAINVEIAVTV